MPALIDGARSVRIAKSKGTAARLETAKGRRNGAEVIVSLEAVRKREVAFPEQQTPGTSGRQQAGEKKRKGK